jgi:hypothetical protein
MAETRRSAFGSWDEWTTHRDKWEDMIRQLATSEDQASQSRAAEEFDAFKRRSQIEIEAWGAVPTVPTPDPDAFDPKRDDILERTEQETGSILGETMTNPPTWGEKTLDFLKGQLEPEKIQATAATAALIPAYIAQSTPGGGLAKSLLKLGTSFSLPPVVGATAHQLSTYLPQNQAIADKERGWGTWPTNPFKPWDGGGTGFRGALGREAMWEAYGQGLWPLGKSLMDIGRFGLMGGRGATQRAKEVLGPYMTLDMVELAPSYAASKLGFVKALGPGILKVPGLRGGALKQYRRTIEATKSAVLKRLESMSPGTLGTSGYDVSNRMFKEAMKYGIKSLKAIDGLYNAAFTAATKVYGDMPVVSMRPFLDVVDDILGGGLKTKVTVGGVTRSLRKPPPETIGKWIKDELANVDAKQSIEGLRDLQYTVREGLDGLVKGDDGFQELTRLNGALTGAMRSFFKSGGQVQRADGSFVDVADDVAKNIYNMFTKADSANKRFWRSTESPAAKILARGEKGLWTRRYLIPKGKERYIQQGTRETDDLFDIAFLNKSPKYLKNLENLVGPKAYRMAGQRWLNDAYTKALAKTGDTVDGLLDADVFLRLTRLDEKPEMVAAILKGSGVKPDDLRAVVKVLKDHPIDPALQQMFVRRIQLQGVSSIGKMGVMTALLAGAGAASGGASMLLVLTALGASRKLATALSKPKLLKALVEYGSKEPGVVRKKAIRRMVPSAIQKIVRIWNEEMGEDDVISAADQQGAQAILRGIYEDIERASRIADPLVRHASPVDLHGNTRWHRFGSEGAAMSDLLY